MNIRIEHQIIRFRITPEEFKLLQSGGRIDDRIVLPNSFTINYAVAAVDRHQPMYLNFHERMWVLEVSNDAIKAFAKTLPSKLGIHHQLPVHTGYKHQYVEVVLEVDAKSLPSIS